MPEAATGGVLRKKVFLEMLQNQEESPVPEETPKNFAKFLRTPFLQNSSERLLLKCRHCNNEARDVGCICYRELDAMFIASAEISEREGKHLTIQLLWVSARLLVTCISLIYLIDEFFFWFLL